MADRFFAVHLQSLVDLERTLSGSLAELERPVQRLTALTETPLPLGAFTEAYSLAERGHRAAAEIQALLQSVHRALEFTAGVTRAVAGAYQAYDEQAAAAVRTAGTMYYSSRAAYPTGG